MPLQRHGQSMIEYAMILMLLIISIIIGGPFLRNSVNAFFRTQDEIVKDAGSENIRQDMKNIPTSGVGSIPPFTCNCDIPTNSPLTWRPLGCGSGPCSRTEMLFNRTCTPDGCNADSACVSVPDCCTGIAELGCGSLLDNTGLYSDCQTIRVPVNPAFAALDPSVIGTCRNSDQIDTTQCAAGEMRVSTTCGTATGLPATYFACRPGYDVCLPACWYTSDPNSINCGDIAGYTETNRNELKQEVAYRKVGGLPANSDNPVRPFSRFASITALQFPYMADELAYANAWQLTWNYVGVSPASSLPACEPARRCQRYCNIDRGYYPTLDGLGCTGITCQDVSRFDDNMGTVSAGQTMTFKNLLLNFPSNFTIRLWADNLNYGVGCFDKNGDMFMKFGTINIYPCDATNPLAFDIAGKKYCYTDTIGASDVPYVESVHVTCPNAYQVYARVHHGGGDVYFDPAVSSLGYRVLYKDCLAPLSPFLSARVHADDDVTIYASDSSGTQGAVLLSTSTDCYSGYQGGQALEPNGAGTIPLMYDSDNTVWLLADVTDTCGGGNGVSIQNIANGACFDVVSSSRPDPYTFLQPWWGYPTGCWWINFSDGSAGLRTRVLLRLTR